MSKILLMENGQIRPVESKKFAQEGALQDYLEQFPDLLPLHEIEDNPPAVIVIGREVGVPSGAIDLLLIDGAGRLILVETKLARNPQARREVVGQIIEYASFVSQWSADQVEQQAANYFGARGDAQAGLWQALAAKRGESTEPLDEDTFRARVDENLHKGNMRLIIVVDEVVEPLRATVTFLNSLSAFEFLILQLRDFELESGRHVFIPSVFGYSPPKQAERKLWNEESFFADATARRSPQEVQVIRELYDLSARTGRAQFGTGTSGGSFTYRVSLDGKRWLSLATVFINSGVQLAFGALKWRGVPRETRAEFRERVNAIPGIRIPSDEATLEKYPGFSFEPLTHKENLERFKEALLWLRQESLKVPWASEGTESTQ